MAMYSFYASVHAQPADAQPGEPATIAGQLVRPLRISPESLSQTPLPLSFEEARERLERLERMYCEPDGSFVWVSSHDAPAWQVDGNLYDRQERLLFVDLKGACPPHEFDRLLSAFGWPDARVMFQLTREAVFLDEAQFRAFAEGRQDN